MKGAAVLAGGDLGVSGFGLCEGVVTSESDDAVDLGVELLDAFEIDMDEVGALELAGLDPVREMVNRGVGDGLFGRGHGRYGFGGRDELVFGGAGIHAGKYAVPAGVGCRGFGDGDFARADAALVEGSHGGAPVAGGLGAVFFGERELD